MTEILVLIGLLSVATFTARRGYAAFVAHLVTTPLLLGAGVIIAPHSLGLLTPSTLEGLTPAMRVGAAWLVLLLGMRGVRPRRDRDYVRLSLGTTGIIAVTWAALGAITFGAITLLEEAGLGSIGGASRVTAVGAAFLLSGILGATGLAFAAEAIQNVPWARSHDRLIFLARHDDVLGALALCAAVWLWPVPAEVAPVYEVSWRAAILVVGLGLLLAASHVLNHGRRMAADAVVQPVFIALIGLVVFTAGMSTSTRLPEAPTAFFLGAALGLTGLGQQTLERGLAVTERPVRIALLVLIGANLTFELGPIILGVFLALARFGLKAAVRGVLSWGAPGSLPLGGVVGAPSTALAFALSFAVSRPDSIYGNSILLTVAVAAGVADLLTLMVWRRRASDFDEELDDEVEEERVK